MEENDETKRFEVPAPPPRSPSYPYGPPGGWGYPPAPVPVKRHRLRSFLLTGFAVVGVFSVVLVITYGAAHQSANGVRVTPSTPISSVHSETSSPSTALSISDWYQNGGERRLSALTDDMTTISVDASALDTVSLSADCTKLTNDVHNAVAYGPIPDARVQVHWSAALGHLRSAGTSCTAGADNMDESQLTTSSREMLAAASEMSQVTDRLTNL